MAHRRSISSFVLLAALVSIAPAARAAKETSPWLEVHSQHFTVITDAGDKKGREIALRFEEMRAVFASLLMKERINQPVPLTIVAFKNDKDYYRCAPLRQGQPIAVPGFFVAGEDQDYIVLNSFEPESWRAVAHQFAHLLLNYNYPPVPGWFDEGMAEYFGSIRPDDKQYEIGSDPELNSIFTEDLLGNQTEVRNPPKSLTELLSGQVWLALPDLLTMKHDTSDYNEPTHHTLFYAQSWMTVHYLLHEKKLPETGNYFNLVLIQHLPVEEAIQKAFGETPAQLDQAIKDYFHSLKPLFVALDASRQADQKASGPELYSFPEIVTPDDKVITVKTIPEADGRAYAGDVKLRIPDRRDAGVQELTALATAPNAAAVREANEREKEASKKDAARGREDTKIAVSTPGNEMAHRALAWDHILRGEFDTATEELGDAAALDQRDMWIRFYLSELKYRMAQTKKMAIQGLPNMMEDLRAVLEWYPEFAEAYDLLAISRTEGGGPVAALQAERAAIQLSPRNQQYLFHLALIYVSDKKWEAARAQLERLKAGGNPQVAAEAREALDKLGNQQKYGAAGGNTTSSGKEIGKPSSPFDVLEEDAAKRAAAAQSQQVGNIADQRASKFFQGRLVGIDCSQPPAAVLTVTSNGTVLKLRTADYKSLLLIGADKFSCEWNDRAVSVNYKPGGLSDGDLVSVEVR